MDVEEQFILFSGLICEPVRARMLWSLLDGRAYTATELAVSAGISATAASNHLARLLEAGMLKVEIQGRHRYYAFAHAEVAYVVEALANLASNHQPARPAKTAPPAGITYCRTCYDHLAGYVGVVLAETMEQKGYLKRSDRLYAVSDKGWKWFARFEILRDEFTGARRPLARQCLDWSERRPHLAGQLGEVFLQKMMQRKWFRKTQLSRQLVVTPKGRQELHALLGLNLR